MINRVQNRLIKLHRITKFYVQDTQVLHVCGAFHCAHGLGIPEALPRPVTHSMTRMGWR